MLFRSSFDKTAPVITLNGDNPQTVILNHPYTELNATAIDSPDGDLTSHIVTNSTAVNVSIQGSYPVTYSVVDSAGNSAVEIRYVSVVVGNAPTITLNGESTINLVKNVDSYSDLGATANDLEDGDLTSQIIIDDSAVNSSQIGSDRKSTRLNSSH